MSEKDEIARLRSVMAAAADEIEQHWDAHCDAEGFGPVNLVRRLRTGKGDYRAGGAALDAALSRRSMTDDLARRAVACRHWRWTPGMLSRCSTDTRRAVYRWLVGLDTRHYGLVCCVEDKHGRPCRNVATLQPGPDDLPDLDDCGTLGCLLGLVRLARMDPYWLPTCLDWEGGMAWVIEAPSRTRQTRHESYAAVLVAALEAAP